ncbi:murein L,D-transpeptidase [Ahrensia sp. R2A130]|uniref:L,D-transpeptidase family protein n=1 Tax=Ahrensia sp. R2A130 TaxID=744979 RepID=UPI0001E08C05|nr:L,D-transpeptidase family protein [Ahrensia sp. R2A130]EFL90532.1 peptidoglycan binding domain-containing protein [Ahrensia sp. R2A130]
MSANTPISRRTALGLALASASAAALPHQALAETAIDRILNAPNRDSWNDSFDATAPTKAKVVTSTPIFAPQTIDSVQQAIAEYSNIVRNGGWPRVPAGKKLELGVSDDAVRALRQRLIISGDLPRGAGVSPQFDTYVDAAVKRFQARHGLPSDGVMGRYSFAALNVSAPIRLGQLQTNLVRLKAMSGYLGDRYVMVNIPAAEIEAVELGRVAQRHTAIVGRESRQTPILNSKIYELNLNPYWTAPKSIILKDIIPLMRKNPNYLTENKILLFDGNSQEVSPQSVNWNTEEAVKLRFRQEPGRINAMGSVKINFPNPHAVYMHDTPQKGIFNKLLRFESSGCVRVKNVRDLLVWLAKDTPGASRSNIESIIASGDRTDLKLTAPVPVYFAYVSAWSNTSGVAHFRDDIYQRDGVDELVLSQN